MASRIHRFSCNRMVYSYCPCCSRYYDLNITFQREIELPLFAKKFHLTKKSTKTKKVLWYKFFSMQSNVLLKWPLFIVSIMGIIFSSIIIFFLIFYMPVQGSSDTKTASITGTKNIIIGKQISIGLPLRLKISKLKIDAPVKSLGLTSDGAMDTTKGPYDVAWYKFGPRPGEKGSAVIAGHYGRWKNGAVSVFNKLNTLVKGDIISVKDDKGAIISFVVRESKLYTPTAEATDVFYSNDGKSHLNLVTCVQDKVSKKYTKRLVVFTDKVIK